MENSQIKTLALKKITSKTFKYLYLYLSLLTFIAHSDQEVDGLDTEGDAIHVWLNYDNKEEIISRYKQNKPILLAN